MTAGTVNAFSDLRLGRVEAGSEGGRHRAARSRPWAVVLVVVCAQILIWLDASILNVAATTLADPVKGLGATPAELEWISSAYTLVFASTLLAGGALADRFGPRSTLIAGLLLFASCSAAAAFAGNPALLIAARAAMGAGSALLMPSTLSIIIRSTPPEKRTRAIAIWSSSSGLGVAIGPLAGGALLSHFWWGSVFLVNVPIVAVTMAGVVAVVPKLSGARRQVIDLRGMALSVLGLSGLVYGIIELGNQETWYGPHVLLPVVVGGALLAVFVALQRTSPAPSLDLRLFRLPGFTAGCVVLLLSFLTLNGHLFYLAFYLQGPRGFSPLHAGTLMIAPAVGIIIGSQLAPMASRLLSARWTVAAGILVMGITYICYRWVDGQTPTSTIVALMGVQGAASGMIGTPLTTAMMSRVPQHLTGAGSAVGSVTRQVGSTLGVAMTGAILSGVYQERMAAAELPARLPAESAQEVRTSAEAARSLAHSLRLPQLAEEANHAFLNAMYTATFWIALLAFAALPVCVVGLRVRRLGRHRRDRRPQGPAERTGSDPADNIQTHDRHER